MTRTRYHKYLFQIFLKFIISKNSNKVYSLGEAGGSIAECGGGGGPALRSRVYHASASPRWASLAGRATSPCRPTPPPNTDTTTLTSQRTYNTLTATSPIPDHLSLLYDTIVFLNLYLAQLQGLSRTYRDLKQMRTAL